VIGANGSVQVLSGMKVVNATFRISPAGSASTSGNITALSRIFNSMEVWWIGTNGSIQDAYWYEGLHWQRFEVAPAGSSSTSGGIAAVSRIVGSMEVGGLARTVLCKMPIGIKVRRGITSS